MRRLVVASYAGMVAFASLFGSWTTGLWVFLAVVTLVVMLRPADAGRAISDRAGWFIRRHRVTSSG
jgi:hypothetical protein